MSEMRFPKEPKDMGNYWDVPTHEPSLGYRWQRFTLNSQVFHVFFYGCCLSCGRGTWATADGTILTQMGHNGLMPVIDDDGSVYRACCYCAMSSHRSLSVAEQGRVLKESGDDFGPVEWPKRHVERMLTAR